MYAFFIYTVIGREVLDKHTVEAIVLRVQDLNTLEGTTTNVS
jgi:hypothetical protein